MNIVLAWKHALYQETFSKEQRVLVPENSVGMLNLTDEDLANVQGGADPGLAGTTTDLGSSIVNGLSNSLGGLSNSLGGLSSGLNSTVTDLSGIVNGSDN